MTDKYVEIVDDVMLMTKTPMTLIMINFNLSGFTTPTMTLCLMGKNC